MSIEKFEDRQPILVRPEGDNILPGGNEIEVWQTIDEENKGRVTAYSQDTIAVPDSEGKYNKELRTQGLSLSEAYGNSQDQLARELADLPLRKDTVLAEINGKVIDAKVYDYFDHEGVKYGAVIDQEGNTQAVSLDVLRGEYQKELRTKHQGGVVLRAAGAKEPKVYTWSPQAAELHAQAAMPTFENPHMLDPMEDVMEPIVFSQIPGEELRGNKVGWFQRDGKMFFLVEPTAESRRKAEFTGEYMAVPAEFTAGLTPAHGSEVVNVSDQVPIDAIQEETTERKSEPETDPFDQLDPEVQAEVKRYRQAQQDKLDSESDKDFAQAAEDGRRIYAVGKSISKPAQEFVDFRL